MNRNIESYLLTMDNWIDRETCDRIVASLESGRWQKHHYDGDPVDLERPAEQQLAVSLGRKDGVAELLEMPIKRAFEFYTQSRRMPWFGVQANHSSAQFHRYRPGNTMVEHCDHLTSLFEGGIPVLSFVAVLNEGFTGGEMVFFGDTPVTLKAGSIVVFPSNFLFPHRVDPIVEGVRYSAVSWAW